MSMHVPIQIQRLNLNICAVNIPGTIHAFVQCRLCRLINQVILTKQSCNDDKLLLEVCKKKLLLERS
jgi:hypothetical protein